MFIRPLQPFDFLRTLRLILGPPAQANGRQFGPLLDHFEDAEYRRAVEFGAEPLLYGVSEDRRGLRVRILAGRGDAIARESVVRLVERQFSTRLDLARFYRRVAGDPVLSRLARSFRGMRIPQSPNIFATVISAILEQQVNLAFAFQVKKALIETYGAHIEFQGRRYAVFPSPAALAILSARELRKIQISGPKARYIIEIARDVLDGRLDLEALRSSEPGAAHARLLEQKGIGPWTAFFVGLLALGHLDALPSADLGLQRAIQVLYGLRRQPTPARVETLARGWSGWRSYATFYLWLTHWESPDWREELIRELQGERHGNKKAQAGN